MPESNRRRNVAIVVTLLILILLFLLVVMTMCPASVNGTAVVPAPTTPTAPTAQPAPQRSASAPPAAQPEEVLTPATLGTPASVAAGSAFTVSWTGPDNAGDYVTIVRTDAAPDASGSYRETRRGASLELTAPMEPGAYEVRYVAARSKTVLGRAPIQVTAVGATLDAPAEVTLGSAFQAAWTGPNNQGDFVTITAKAAPDDAYGSYAETKSGSPVTLTAPVETGDAEVRYVSGQGRRVLARRDIKVVAAAVTLAAPEQAVAGTTIDVAWTGPNNTGDYVTIVPSDAPDGQYGNYTETSTGSPLKLLTPIMAGSAELRYMTGQGRRVLSRRPITIVAAEITLSAPPECKAGADVSVAWTGPNNRGDYITIVPKAMPDGRYAAYTETSKGSPLSVKAPKEAGEAEVRYMAGQGNKVLARVPIKVAP